jgi:hypothetical protein
MITEYYTPLSKDVPWAKFCHAVAPNFPLGIEQVEYMEIVASELFKSMASASKSGEPIVRTRVAGLLTLPVFHVLQSVFNRYWSIEVQLQGKDNTWVSPNFQTLEDFKNSNALRCVQLSPLEMAPQPKPIKAVNFDHGQSLYYNREFADVKLIFRDGKIHAHRCILALQPYFNILFSDRWLEGTQQEINMSHDFSCKTYERLVEYLYLGKVSDEWLDVFDNAIDLLHLADKVEITSGLRDICYNAIRANLIKDPAIFADIMIAAHDLNDPYLHDLCKWVISHKNKLNFQFDFSTWDKEELKKIIHLLSCYGQSEMLNLVVKGQHQQESKVVHKEVGCLSGKLSRKPGEGIKPLKPEAKRAASRSDPMLIKTANIRTT